RPHRAGQLREHPGAPPRRRPGDRGRGPRVPHLGPIHRRRPHDPDVGRRLDVGPLPRAKGPRMITRRMGQVTAVTATTCTVTIGGAETPTPGIPFLNRPRVGATVVMLVTDDTDYLVIGSLGGTSDVPVGS